MQSAMELYVNRMNTKAFIAANPVTIRLVPRITARAPTGGVITTNGTPRLPQTFHLIQQSPAGGSIEQRTEDGTERQVEFILLGEWNAVVGIGDWWERGDAFYEVIAIVPTNNYEFRAVVQAHYKRVPDGGVENPDPDPSLASIAGLGAWWDASVLTGSDGASISTLADQSGNGHNLVASGSGRPILKLNAMAGRPIARFDGVNSFMESNYVPATGGDARTFISVLKITLMGEWYEHVYHYGATSFRGAYGLTARTEGNSKYGNHYWGDSFQGPNSTDGETVIISQVYGSGVDRVYISGTEAAQRSINALTGSAAPLRFGKNAGGGEGAKFDLAECGVWPRALTVQEIQQAVDILSAKWI